MDYIVNVNNVTKKIRGDVIIEDVNFNLKAGKIYGLVGANGSGKSTLLKIILGLYSSKGDVSINGYDIRKNYKEGIKEISGIVDYVSFYEHLTAVENLRYFALLYGVSLSRVYEVLDIVKLDAKDKKCVKNYSLGMKQRLGLAISLLKDPKILILDEPTNGLDPKGILELRNLLLSFKDKTIIISSHIISEIEKIVDEVLFINNKKIYQKVYNRSENAKIKFKLDNYERAGKLLGSSNLFEKGITYGNENDVSKDVKTLINNGIKVYRVEEESTLEDEIISMMESD